MPSITIFLRLEPGTRGEDLERGLAARVYDPAWMLARQWQLGEFMGEDAGTPVSVRLRAEQSRLTRYFPDANAVTARTGVSVDGTAAPLESIVEREPVRGRVAWTAQQRAEAGLEWIRRLAAVNLSSYAAAYNVAYPLRRPKPSDRDDYDVATLRYLEVMADRAPDGERLFAALRGAVRKGKLPSKPAIAAKHGGKVLAQAQRWIEWVETLVSEPGAAPSAWKADRLEYGFAVSAPASGRNDLVLEAAEYPGGSLDWYAFAERRGAMSRRRGDPAPQAIVRTSLPTPLRFRGMPNARWWEFEQGDVDFGRVGAAPSDLARMLVLEYMLVYGNDFFALPIQMEVGSVCYTRSVVVTDVFGVRLQVLPSARTNVGAPGWTIFSLSSHGSSRARSVIGDASLFVLPPVVGQLMSSPAIEEVLFARDEMANMVWGVERRVEGSTGDSFDRAEEERWRRDDGGRATPPTPSTTPLVYHLEATVPANWFPLVPVHKGNALYLKRGVMGQPSGAISEPLGELLGEMNLIHEEEVPREGIRVTRDYQYARWVDGSTHLWIGRRKTVGAGKGRAACGTTRRPPGELSTLPKAGAEKG
jgi:hypothetical protein